MILFIKWAVTAIALVVAVYIVPGITVDGNNALVAVLITAAILGFLNLFIKPILTLLSCGLVAATLGLFMFVINAFLLWLASWIAVNWFDAGFRVDGIIAALVGSIIVSIVSFVINMFVPDRRRAA